MPFLSVFFGQPLQAAFSTGLQRCVENIFNLKTTDLVTGTYVVTFNVAGDPTPHTELTFQVSTKANWGLELSRPGRKCPNIWLYSGLVDSGSAIFRLFAGEFG